MAEEQKGQGLPILIFKLYLTLQLLLYSNEHQASVCNISGVGEMIKGIKIFSYSNICCLAKNILCCSNIKNVTEEPLHNSSKVHKLFTPVPEKSQIKM